MKCSIENKIYQDVNLTNPRISCTLSGVRIEWSEDKFLKGKCVSPNQAMILKQASDDKSFAHAAGELLLYADKKNKISSLCLDRFYLLAKFSGTIF